MSSIGPELPPHLQNKLQDSSQSDEEEETSVVGPQIPLHLAAGPSKPPSQHSPRATTEARKEEEEESDSDEDNYGPALPPELLASRSKSSTSAKVVGPSLPQHHNINQNHDRRYGDDADEDSDVDVGPMPLPAGISFEEEDGVREFMEREERRRKQIEVCILFYFDALV